ncbi:MAG: putative ABC transport system permease protein [Rhodothermales bacterium]|jgi:putative ABC transport system permease protein
MFKSHLKTSLRALTNRKGFSFINVGGLAMGVACFALIGLYVQEEVSYDRYNENADHVYPMGLHIFLDGTESNFATVAAPVAQGLKDNFPEIVEATRISKGGAPVLRPYAELARHLSDRNIASLRLDLRGHGESIN